LQIYLNNVNSHIILQTMSETKYRYNTQTLSYERLKASKKDRFLRLVSLLVTGLVFSFITFFISYAYIDSPKEKELKRENQRLYFQYHLLSKRVDEFSGVLSNIQHRDDNIYRVIFEADPIPENIRLAGVGGIDRYKDLENFSNAKLVIEATKKLDKLERQLYIQSKSFDEVYNLARQKEQLLSAIPAIQPVSNKDLKRMASGFGYRIHPIYKTEKFHAGMDFTAPAGTEVYATGSGTVVNVEKSNRGWGNHIIIDHGFGYETVYAHLSEFSAKVGQSVNRGDLIGFVGNTGTSTAPHLHYEVHKNKQALNPVNFYFNDLTPEEYDLMIQLSSTANQSFD
jgi:murein DD-endopeptidase MepM/ murein hydrolase activator NlpD